ncbi:hypothetical protein LTR56_001517 [Elasticomyces elasticus]|nr:hypothetical protein LTR56_001517 [Elasticomyces elasticus]KAK3668561.1 hypothetical protein LTR22_000448 [Elasticomyces elasticus]KAK4931913.1 hypothetical protein LTR49_001600 [Elasticomyces elasticus]KAK5768556.1 hypothetical protein LTS12_001344 [Elasticomyces elasticus]
MISDNLQNYPPSSAVVAPTDVHGHGCLQRLVTNGLCCANNLTGPLEAKVSVIADPTIVPEPYRPTFNGRMAEQCAWYEKVWDDQGYGVLKRWYLDWEYRCLLSIRAEHQEMPHGRLRKWYASQFDYPLGIRRWYGSRYDYGEDDDKDEPFAVAAW